MYFIRLMAINLDWVFAMARAIRLWLVVKSLDTTPTPTKSALFLPKVRFCVCPIVVEDAYAIGPLIWWHIRWVILLQIWRGGGGCHAFEKVVFVIVLGSIYILRLFRCIETAGTAERYRNLWFIKLLWETSWFMRLSVRNHPLITNMTYSERFKNCQGSVSNPYSTTTNANESLFQIGCPFVVVAYGW